MSELVGFVTSSPICAMAAMGLVRVLTEECKLDVALAWNDGYAVLDGISRDELEDHLVDHMRTRAQASELNWAETARGVSSENFHAACAGMKGNAIALGFMAAWGTNAVLREGKIGASRLDLTSGQQKLIKDLRGLAARFSEPATALEWFRSAFDGGPYVEQTSFGWDPVAVRRFALEARAPTSTKPPGKPGLVWLAFESLPLHPVVPAGATRVQTVGIDDRAYYWPIWEGALRLPQIKLVRTLTFASLLRRPGISEVWKSAIASSGKYGALLPASRER